MTIQLFISMMLFMGLMTGTPGPNNMLLTYSGANFGYWRSVPHMLGVSAGLVSMVLLMALGLSWMLVHYPWLLWGMKLGGTAYLVYLAWCIWLSSQSVKGNELQRPMRFVEACLFQYLNPKAWLMTSSAVASFSVVGETYWWTIATLSLALIIVCTCTETIWVNFGMLISRCLHSVHARKIFNGSMASLTILCAVFLWV